ncbi:MAG: hypothetical protein AAGF83_26830, partial [Cyanobacteria bacterium P01_G01_bin.67]
LSDLKIGQSGQAFVIDRQGQLISSSTDDPLMVEEGDTLKINIHFISHLVNRLTHLDRNPFD